MPIQKTHNDFTKTCCHMLLETKAIVTREAYWCVSAQHFRWKPAWPLVRWLPTPTASPNTRLISQAKGAISSLQLPKALPEFLNVGAHTMGIWVTWKWWRSRTGRVWNRIARARHQEVLAATSISNKMFPIASIGSSKWNNKRLMRRRVVSKVWAKSYQMIHLLGHAYSLLKYWQLKPMMIILAHK